MRTPSSEGAGDVAALAQDVPVPFEGKARPRRKRSPRKVRAWRRAVAVGADVLVAGAGHYALGHTRRGVGWFLAVQALYIGSVAFGYEGSRLGFLGLGACWFGLGLSSGAPLPVTRGDVPGIESLESSPLDFSSRPSKCTSCERTSLRRFAFRGNRCTPRFLPRRTSW